MHTYMRNCADVQLRIYSLAPSRCEVDDFTTVGTTEVAWTNCSRL